VAAALADKGARVGLIARTGPDLVALERDLGPLSAHAVADVADREELSRAIGDLSQKLGSPAILVNNAGIGSYSSMIDEFPETYERLMRVNYLGTVYAIQAVLPAMTDLGRDHIVNVGSIAGRLGAPFESAYSASKFAVTGLTEALAAEVAASGMRVSLVNPGPIATDFARARGVRYQRSIPKPADPGAVADLIVSMIERDRFEATTPRWLRFPAVVRAAWPSAYLRGLVRSARNEVSRQ
jgi:3-oxoacyl-[acyl-carrier protein] reductase